MTPSEANLPPKRPDKPGIIYLARNKVNGHVYVGQTRYGLNHRRETHESEARRGSKFRFHAAIRKYGLENIEFSVLQKCCGIQCLNLAEQWWIAHLDSLAPKGYNLTGGGGAAIVSEETRIKMSLNAKKRCTPEYMDRIRPLGIQAKRTPESREKMALCMRGKKKSPEHVRKMSEQMRGMFVGDKNPFFGKKHTKETKAKMSQIASRNMTPERIEAMQRGRKPISEETRGKISAKVRARGWVGDKHPSYGRPCSEESKKRVSETHKGKTLSAETRSKISAAAMGNKSNLGKKFTEEHKRKIGEASRRNETWRYAVKTKI